jgi:hypothetical protein
MRLLTANCGLLIGKTGDGVVGDELGDLLWRLRSFRPEPVRGPVERAEERAGGNRGVGGAERMGADAAGDERTDAALVLIAFGDDARAQTRRQRVDFQVRRGSFDLVEQTEDVSDRHLAQAAGQRSATLARGGERVEEAIDRSVLTEEEQFVLAAEVVIEVGGREVGGGRDVAHAGRGEATGAEDPSGGTHDLDAAGIRPDRTTVRKLNHRSILAGFWFRSTWAEETRE